jgi:heme-degrading monooxygenase HmoA
MRAITEGVPGFVSFKRFRADEGERVSIIDFESEEALQSGREHPEHRNAREVERG